MSGFGVGKIYLPQFRTTAIFLQNVLEDFMKESEAVCVCQREAHSELHCLLFQVKQSEKWERMLGSRRMERKHLMVGNEAKKEEEEREEETAKAQVGSCKLWRKSQECSEKNGPVPRVQQVIKTTMDQKELSGDQSEAGMDEEETMEVCPQP